MAGTAVRRLGVAALNLAPAAPASVLAQPVPPWANPDELRELAAGEKNQWQEAERVRNAAAFDTVVAMLGAPLVGDLLALSSMFGYSR